MKQSKQSVYIEILLVILGIMLGLGLAISTRWLYPKQPKGHHTANAFDRAMQEKKPMIFGGNDSCGR